MLWTFIFHFLVTGNQLGYALVDDMQDQENALIQCIHQLESAEATRSALVSQLKEALCDQVKYRCYTSNPSLHL